MKAENAFCLKNTFMNFYLKMVTYKQYIDFQ